MSNGAEGTNYVYELFDASGQHLYIGCTGNVGQRLTAHTQKPWWIEVAKMTVTAYPDLKMAAAVERALILTSEPLHNTQEFSDRRRNASRTRRQHEQGVPCDPPCYLHREASHPQSRGSMNHESLEGVETK